MTFPRILLFAAALVACVTSGSGIGPTAAHGQSTGASDAVPLYTNLGSHHKTISTKVPATQQYFDQGLRLVYGFNHAEAIRAFQRAAALDPTCAMCYWGIALAYGPHVNAPMDAPSGVAAYAALQKARGLMSSATPAERAYIEAVGQRYAAEPPANRAPLDISGSAHRPAGHASYTSRDSQERRAYRLRPGRMAATVRRLASPVDCGGTW